MTAAQPPAPEAGAQADGKLSAEIAEALCRHEFGAEFLSEQSPEWQQHLREGADAVLALPAVRQLLAAQEALGPLIEAVGRGDGVGLPEAYRAARRALDGGRCPAGQQDGPRSGPS